MIPYCILAIEDDSDRTFMTDLFLQYQRLMYHEILKITRDEISTEDVLQNTLVRLIDKIQKLRSFERNQLVNYIISASKNSAYYYLRQQKHQTAFSFDDCIDYPDVEHDRHATEEFLIRAEELNCLFQIWPQLDERSRYLLEGRYILELSMEEMAQALDIQVASIRMALTRARKAALRLLEKEVNA